MGNDTNGVALNQQGGTYESGDQSTSTYIKLEPNTTYYFTGQWANLYSQNTASAFTRQISAGAFTTTSSEIYIRITRWTSTNCMLNEGSKAYPYQPYNANKHITNDEAQFLKNVMPNFYQIKKFTGTWGQWVNTKGNDNVNVLKALVSHEISEDDYHYVDLIKTYDSVLESIAWVYLNSGSSSPFHDVSDDNEVIIYYVDLYEA
jgi:hypothetical protein